MNWQDINAPRRYEDVDLTVNDTTFSEISAVEFQDIIANISGDGSLSYTIWHQDEDTDYELKTLEVMIDYKNGDITNYETNLMD